MRVVEGTSLELSDGTWIKPEIEFSDVDLEAALVEWGVNRTPGQLPLLLRYELLSTLAQMCLAQRVLEARPNDTQWQQSTGIPAVAAAQQKLRTLVAQAKG